MSKSNNSSSTMITASESDEVQILIDLDIIVNIQTQMARMNDKMDKMMQQLDSLQSSMEADNEIAKNRKLRRKQPFAFQPTHSTQPRFNNIYTPSSTLLFRPFINNNNNIPSNTILNTGAQNESKTMV
jgi:hypothetical protein